VLGWAFKRGIADPLLKFGLMPIVVPPSAWPSPCATACAPATAPKRIHFPPVSRQAVQHSRRDGHADRHRHAGVPLVLVFATQAFLQKTVTGRAMQAVAQNTDSATVLGIDVPRMIFYTFAINAVLACAAALLITRPIWPSSTWASRWAPRRSSPPYRRLQQFARRPRWRLIVASARTSPRPTSRRPTKMR